MNIKKADQPQMGTHQTGIKQNHHAFMDKELSNVIQIYFAILPSTYVHLVDAISLRHFVSDLRFLPSCDRTLVVWFVPRVRILRL